MASKELSILLTAKDLASKTIGQVGRNVQKLDSVSARAGRGMRTLGTNLKRMAAIGATAGIGILAVSVKSGIQSLATLETAITSVQGAIDAMGQSSRISGKQVAQWANEIESATGAAFDDKDITSATANLIRYGNIAPRQLKRVMVVMTDLAAKNGNVEAASKAMAKALADPLKATRLLKDAGVVLTKAEQKKLTALVKANKVHKAQALLIDLVAEKTKGAALASQGPYERSLATMNDAIEDAQRALGEGFLPVITKVADWLKKGLADPGTMSNIRNLGQNLAGAFDSAVDFAKGIDWKGIGDGLKVAADWAKRLFDAFMSLPPEAKGILLALGGLDKLSGGAVSGIVGELGKGLIKGVLGMTAGVVNIKAGVVNSGAGVPGKGGKGVPGLPVAGGLGAAAMTVIAPASIVALGAAVGGVFLYGIPKLVTSIYGTGGGDEGAGMRGKLGPSNGLTTPVFEKWMGAQLGSLNTIGENTGTGSTHAKERGIEKAVTDTGSDTRAEQIATKRAVAAVEDEQAKALVAFRAGERTSATGLSTVATTTRTSAAATAIAQATSASRIVSAIAANRPVTNVYVYASGANVKYGAKTGSAGTGSGGGGTNRIPS